MQFLYGVGLGSSQFLNPPEVPPKKWPSASASDDEIGWSKKNGSPLVCLCFFSLSLSLFLLLGVYVLPFVCSQRKVSGDVGTWTNMFWSGSSTKK